MFRVMRDHDGAFFVQKDCGSTWNSDWVQVSRPFANRGAAEKWAKDKIKGDTTVKTVNVFPVCVSTVSPKR